MKRKRHPSVKELLAKIAQLEERIRELEGRGPLMIPYPVVGPPPPAFVPTVVPNTLPPNPSHPNWPQTVTN